MIQSKHTKSFCFHCGHDIVRCSTCNNNCCNGGYGTVNGKQCSDCPEAYGHQDLMYQKEEIIFAEVEEFDQKEYDKLFRRSSALMINRIENRRIRTKTERYSISKEAGGRVNTR